MADRGIDDGALRLDVEPRERTGDARACALAARELYDNLFRTAADAEIPVLNWTRLETLTGTVNR